MRHVSRSLAVMVASTLSLGTGCATAHFKGEYAPNGIPKNYDHLEGTSDKQYLGKGHDWVLFWGIVELASSDMAEKAKKHVRPDEVLTDVEVKNHISLPGALLWIVTAGIVSHHDLTLRGRVSKVKTVEPERTSASSGAQAGRTIIINPVGGETAGRGAGSGDYFAESTIDRPVNEVASNFNAVASRSGLIPIADIRWDGLSSSERRDMQGEVPQNRLEGVDTSNIHTFLVTNDKLSKDVRMHPRCGSFLPGIVCYEKGGRTYVLAPKLSQRLKMLETTGQVGEGKAMSRADYDEHMGYARSFDRSCEDCIEGLRTARTEPGAGSERGLDRGTENRGTENRGTEDRGTENRGTENRGSP